MIPKNFEAIARLLLAWENAPDIQYPGELSVKKFTPELYEAFTTLQTKDEHGSYQCKALEQLFFLHFRTIGGGLQFFPRSYVAYRTSRFLLTCGCSLQLSPYESYRRYNCPIDHSTHMVRFNGFPATMSKPPCGCIAETRVDGLVCITPECDKHCTTMVHDLTDFRTNLVPQRKTLLQRLLAFWNLQ